MFIIDGGDFTDMKKIFNVCVALIVVMVLVATTMTAGAASASTFSNDVTKTSDPDTINSFVDADASTLNNGRVWTDKTVSNSTLTLRDGDGNVITDTGNVTADDDNFVVALSALSQAYEVSTTVAGEKRKANVCLCIDASSSMSTTPISATDNTNRLALTRTLAKEFVTTLTDVAVNDSIEIHLCLVAYMGDGYCVIDWTILNRANETTINNKIATNTFGGTDNTNCQAGAWMAQYMFSDDFAEYDQTLRTTEEYTTNYPTNINDENTDNYIVFMTDGAPNRYYYNTDDIRVSTYNSTLKSNTGIFATNIKKPSSTNTDLHGTDYTSEEAVSPGINDTDYKKLAAQGLLDVVDTFKNINNMTCFSLGLGQWFTTDANSSIFPTAPHLMQLVAGVANNVFTKEYAISFLGNDVENGCMPGKNPGYPEFISSTFIKNSAYVFKGSAATKTYSEWEDCLSYMESLELVGNLEERKLDGIYYMDPAVSALVKNYYGGSSKQHFTESFRDIANSITTSLNNYITDSSDPAYDGDIIFSDHIGEYMQVSSFNGVFIQGSHYTSGEIAQSIISYLDNGETLHTSNLTDTQIKRILYKKLKYDLTDAQLDTLLRGNRAAGNIRYTGNNNCKAVIYWYGTGDYDTQTATTTYIAPYYDANGNVLDPPSGATTINRTVLVSGLVDGEGVFVNDTDQDLFYMTINLEQSLDSDTQSLHWAIPPSLLPIRKVSVSNAVAFGDNTSPISLVYKVGIRPDFIGVDSDYSHTNSDGTITLYTNAWESANNYCNTSTSTAYFVTSKLNPFYCFTQDYPIYIKNADDSYSQVSNIPTDYAEQGLVYYIFASYYDENGLQTKTYSSTEYPEADLNNAFKRKMTVIITLMQAMLKQTNLMTRQCIKHRMAVLLQMLRI